MCVCGNIISEIICFIIIYSSCTCSYRERESTHAYIAPICGHESRSTSNMYPINCPRTGETGHREGEKSPGSYFYVRNIEWERTINWNTKLYEPCRQYRIELNRFKYDMYIWNTIITPIGTILALGGMFCEVLTVRNETIRKKITKARINLYLDN